MSKRTLVMICSILLVVPLLFMGCGGSDGATGAQGPQGIQGIAGSTGPAGEALSAQATPEACSVCHQSIATTHAQTGVTAVTVTGSGIVGGNFVTTFNVKVDGVNSDAFALYRAYAHWDNAALQTTPATLITTGQRTTLFSTSSTSPVTIASLVSNGSGNYSATVPAANVIDNADYLFVVQNAAGTLEGSASATLGTTSLRNLVSDEGCASCHGPTPAWSAKFAHYAVGGSKCQVCHSITSRGVGIISLDASGVRVESAQKAGTNAVEYFHGIHKSAGMPDGKYFRTTSLTGGENSYEIGYPSDMKNCKVCHTTPAQLTTAASAPPSYYLCMSCHQKWDGFVDHLGVKIFAADNFHRTFDMTTNCMTCHVELPTMNEAADFHDSFESVDSHYDSFYRGTDVSFDNPDNVSFAIAGVTKSGDNVTFTWTASRNGAPVDPCNATTAGASFQGLGAYLAYAKGDDWVNDNVGSAPGQPASARNLFTSLATTCAANVATTTGLRVSTGATGATKALLAIGGKALDNIAVTVGTTSTTKQIFVRVASPTYAFSMANGSSVAARRSAVNNAKCLSCHRGTLYQHGGDRVDNEQLCVICHNPASADKNNRKDYFQIVNSDNTVNRNKTYDGKTNESYDMRTLIHAIHGVDKRQNPLVIYRSRGIYAFASPTAAKPTGWPSDNMTVYGSLNNRTIAHTWTVVDYPRPANACLACHNEGLYEIPDQTKAVGMTVEPGTSWASQSDDISIGPAAAACTACHSTSTVRSHAQHEGYMANVTKESMLEKAQPYSFWSLLGL
jgi:OmcA/MtrC family decaheme c-type cytochrome